MDTRGEIEIKEINLRFVDTRSGKEGEDFIEMRAALKTQRDDGGLGMSAQSSLESSTTRPRLQT